MQVNARNSGINAFSDKGLFILRRYVSLTTENLYTRRFVVKGVHILCRYNDSQFCTQDWKKYERLLRQLTTRHITTKIPVHKAA